MKHVVKDRKLSDFGPTVITIIAFAWLVFSIGEYVTEKRTSDELSSKSKLIEAQRDIMNRCSIKLTGEDSTISNK